MTAPLTPAERLAACLDRMTRMHPRVIDLSLDRVLRLLDRLGAPHLRLPPAIHIAGTNGKGSVLAYLAAALAAAGRTAHSYSSPHLVRFNERVVLNGEMAGDAELADALERTEAANEGGDITYFEITTAAAFLLYAERPADYLLLETGLGGRLDATNVIDRPRLTAITPVSLDHQAFLGDTIEAIAAEKAGILKPGVPALIGRQPLSAEGVLLARADTVGAPVRLWGREFRLDAGDKYVGPAWHFPMPAPSLPGAHQRENAALALAVLEALEDPAVTPDVAAAGVRQARWPARLEELTGRVRVPEGWRVWLDGGHNPAAGAALADWAAGRPAAATRPLHLVGAMLKVKDARGFLAPLAPHASTYRAVPMPDGHEALAADELAEIAKGAGLASVATAAGWREAVADILSGPGTSGDILICGSLYLAGAVLGDLERSVAPQK